MIIHHLLPYCCISAVSRGLRISFCMPDGLATYYIPLESSLQDIFEGACFTCVFLSFTCKNKDHPSFSSVSLHSAVSGRFHIMFCMSDGLATYYILLENSLQDIFEGACFTCVFWSFTCKNKDHPSFSPESLHSAVSRRFCIIFCMSDGLATDYIPLESSLQEIFEGACFTYVFLSFTCANKDHSSFFHITVFCSKRKVLYHFLHLWWFCNILYTIRKLSSRDLWGCMLYLCIFKFHLQKQGSSIIFFHIAAFCSS